MSIILHIHVWGVGTMGNIGIGITTDGATAPMEDTAIPIAISRGLKRRIALLFSAFVLLFL